jgi:EAL domain-containing protein (putative c-di-GMP-specific phosphodiesterase class I)/GGDEF domain-containing protein
MDIAEGLRKRSHLATVNILAGPQAIRHFYCLLFILALLALGTLTVYHTGGTAYAYPYLMLIPVLFASAWYGLAGGLFSALLASSLMAVMPLNVEQAVMQEPVNWLLRMGLYLLLGGVAGGLFQSLRGAYREREALVRTDPRSGLPNQVALDQDLYAWKNSEGGREAQVGLIIVRLTDITDVLEAMGADASDELAGLVGERLRHLVGGDSSVYRFSVSELIVLLPGADEVLLEAMARRIIEAGEDNLVVQSVPVRVQLVLGSAFKSGLGSATDELISEARIALFSAIRKGVSYCPYDSDLSKKKLSHITLISNVRRGLERGEFELHYQPKVRLRDGALVGSEALIRWRDSERQLIPPGQFMPKVEDTTLIAPVTEFVSRAACEFVAWQSHPVSINFSARNLMDERMPAYLEQQVRRLGVAPAHIEVEVTESALIQNLQAARVAIERLRAMGFSVSIDDFGTGFASFEYLQHLPITGIKIDRAFVQPLESQERSRKLMASLVDMGHALDLMVTAEGVENAEQYRLLRSMGCDQVQGFFFTPALPGRQFAAWCEHYRPVYD